MGDSFSIKKHLADLGVELSVQIAPALYRSALLRKSIIWTGEKTIRILSNHDDHEVSRPLGVMIDRNEFKQAIIKMSERALAMNLSPDVLRRLLQDFVEGIMIGENREVIESFYHQFGTHPPSFLTISPGKTCNLQCKGCYASAGPSGERLEWEIFDRIITEAKQLWGVRFMVLSGGEPLAYRDNAKGILDMIERHPDIFFLMYTNGTLINDAVSKRLAKLGNLTPALSLEGWREHTDERRGRGVYEKVLEAMARLRDAGVPFGISLTANRNNLEEILSDEFIDFFFEEQGALYGWIFHYMPIGRSYTLDLMPSPEQRVWMWKRVWEIIRERHIFLADFWNHATLSDGCISAGRTGGGGYLYIDWNGTVAPCVFVPYSPINIKDVYAKNGNLNDIWQNPFFSDIRKWQENYWNNHGNWLAPCLIRDHHADLRQLIIKHEPEPSDEEARNALLDSNYVRGMEKYDKEYQALTDPIWRDVYLNPKGRK